MSFVFPINAGKYDLSLYFKKSVTPLVKPGSVWIQEDGTTCTYVQANAAIAIAAPATNGWAATNVIASDRAVTGSTAYTAPFTKVAVVPTAAGTYFVVGFILNPTAAAYTVDANSYIMMINAPTVTVVTAS